MQLLSDKCEINPHATKGLSHPYNLNESTLIFRCIWSTFFIFISFFDEIHVSKLTSPRWDAGYSGVYSGVSSGAILFAYVP